MSYPRNFPRGEPMRPDPAKVAKAEHALAVAPSRDHFLSRWGLKFNEVREARLGLIGQELAIPFYGPNSELLGVKLRHLAKAHGDPNRFRWLNAGRSPALYNPLALDQDPVLLAEGPLKALALRVILGRPVGALANGASVGIPEEGWSLFEGKRVWYVADPDPEGLATPSILTRQLQGVV